jgi:hypothetical protein
MLAAVDEWLTQHQELVLWLFAALLLLLHFNRGRRVMTVSTIVMLMSVITLAAAIFFILWLNPEPAPFTLVAALLVAYGVGLFVVLSEVMFRGGAKLFTRVRGEHWIKEMDYVYLTMGAAGILISMNHIDLLTGRLEGTDILAPLVLTTAVVIRLLKKRADIGGWNKLN